MGGGCMDVALQQAINEFGRRHNRPGVIDTWLRRRSRASSEAERSRLFEHFATYHVLRSIRALSYEDSLSNFVLTGNKRDLGLDAVAFAIGGELALDRDDLQQRLGSPDAMTADIEVVFIQATLSESPQESKVAGLVNGFNRFMEPKAGSRENDAIRERRAAKTYLMDWLAKNRPGYRPRCSMFMVWTGRNLAVKDDMASLADSAWQNSRWLSSVFSADSSYQLLNCDDLLDCVRKDAQRGELDLKLVSLAPGRQLPGAPASHLAVIDGATFVSVIADRRNPGRLDESLFVDNVRGELEPREGGPAERMDHTLLSERRGEFFSRNNGIVIVARKCEIDMATPRVVLSGAQIVNGCQTAHALFRHRQAIAGQVDLSLKIICADDDGLIDGIIESTNNQVPITDVQLLSRRSYLRWLEMFFEAKQANGGLPELWFERRVGSRGLEREQHPENVMSIEDLLKAFVSIYHELPERVHNLSWADFVRMVPDDVFNPSHDRELYYAAAVILLRCRQFMKTLSGGIHLYPARNHLAYVTRVLAAGAANWPGLQPLDNIEQDYVRLERTLPDYAREIEQALRDDKKAQKIVAKAHALILDAIKEQGGTFNAEFISRLEVGALIKEKARLASAR